MNLAVINCKNILVLNTRYANIKTCFHLNVGIDDMHFKGIKLAKYMIAAALCSGAAANEGISEKQI